MAVRRVQLGDYVIITNDTDVVRQHTFLLVHGIGMGISYFAELREALLPHGRVVAIDLPGFGDSPEPEQALSMTDTGRLLIDFVETEGLLDPVLVGHSMGTQVVAEAAAQRPDLFPELVLLAPTVNVRERTVRQQAMRMVQDLFHESPKVIGLGLVNYAKAGPRWFIKKLRTMMAHDVEKTFPHIESHTLVIRGTLDPVCPRQWAEEVTRLIPDARLGEIEGRGHETMVQGGERAAELILDHLRTH